MPQLVLQFCENGSLSTYLRAYRSGGKEGPSLYEKHHMALDIVRGMTYIHDRGFLHRDLAVGLWKLERDTGAALMVPLTLTLRSSLGP